MGLCPHQQAGCHKPSVDVFLFFLPTHEGAPILQYSVSGTTQNARTPLLMAARSPRVLSFDHLFTQTLGKNHSSSRTSIVCVKQVGVFTTMCTHVSSAVYRNMTSSPRILRGGLGISEVDRDTRSSLSSPPVKLSTVGGRRGGS